MRRVFHHYETWEDYHAGMYELTVPVEAHYTEKAKELLGNPQHLRAAMDAVTRCWQIASETNLTHIGRNRQAWLGQAACAHHAGAPEYLTRRAWNLLTSAEQIEANLVADSVIAQWEKEYQGAQTLFG